MKSIKNAQPLRVWLGQPGGRWAVVLLHTDAGGFWQPGSPGSMFSLRLVWSVRYRRGYVQGQLE